MRKALLAALMVLLVVGAGCTVLDADNQRRVGPLRPKLQEFHVDNNKSVTIVVRLENTGNENLTHLDGDVFALTTPAGESGATIEGKVLHEEYAQPPTSINDHRTSIVNGSRMIAPHEIFTIAVHITYDKPLPDTTHFAYEVSMRYIVGASEKRGWSYGPPCMNMKGEEVRTDKGNSCERIFGFGL